MKKILPVLVSWLLVLSFGFAVPAVLADTTDPSTTTINHNQAVQICGNVPIQDCYIPDKDVAFAARNAIRSRELLNFVLEHFKWDQTGTGQALDLGQVWKQISFVVYGTLGLFVLAAAFLLIITRGKSLTIRKFIPRFIFVLVLVFFSFSLVRFLYQIGDVVQQFSLESPSQDCKDSHPDNKNISDCDLLSIGFEYDESNNPDYILGARRPESKYDEQVFTTILMTKLTAISYYAMFAILFIRKIILWFFLIISPIFPLLLLFPIIRNTAKLWIGEFFRWLLYAPLFAIFLKGLVMIWQGGIGFALNPTAPSSATAFPTATDILLGGPGQQVSINNNLNTPETFIQYVVALIMLWLVIVLPFVLLKIFLDYLYNASFVENNIVKYLATNAPGGVLNHYNGSTRVSRSPEPPRGPSVPPPVGAGLAMNLPAFDRSPIKEIERNMAETAKTQQSIISESSVPTSAGLAREIPSGASRPADLTRNIDQGARIGQSIGASASQPAMSQAAMDIEAKVAASQQEQSNISQQNQATNSNSQNIANQQNISASQRNQQSATNLASQATSQVAANIEQSVAQSQNQASNVINNLDQSASQSQMIAGASDTASTGVVNAQTAQTLVNNVISNEEARNSSVSNFYPRLEAAFDRAVMTISQPAQEMAQQFKEAIIEVFNTTNLTIPTMRDIARYDSELTTKEASERVETSKVSEIINRIAGSSPIATPAEKQRYADIRQKLVSESQRGNSVANSIISAAAPQQATLRETNLVQQVTVEDYEQVKKMWKENYSKANPPMGPNGQPVDRKVWLQQEVRKIPEVIDLLLSGDPQKVAQGKEMVNKILPFLLLGGFSKAEVIAYLKAKLAAAKETLDQVLEIEKDEDTKVEVETKQEAKPKTMEAADELPDADEVTKNPPATK